VGDAKGEPTKPIVFKMHGSIDRQNYKNDSYLITEEDYVNFLGRDQGNYVPPYINGLMRGKNLLFIGYSLEDWNIRVILSKLLKPTKRVHRPSGKPDGGPANEFESDNEPSQVRYWAIVRGRSDAEQRVWQSKDLNIYPIDLREFSDKLVTALDQQD
jgi:SIR2-like domain